MSLGQLYGNMQEAYQQMQTPLIYQEPSDRVNFCIYSFSFKIVYCCKNLSPGYGIIAKRLPTVFSTI